MNVDTFYVLNEVYVDDNGNICTKNIRTFDTVKDAEEFKRICSELKPDGKFIIELDYDFV